MTSSSSGPPSDDRKSISIRPPALKPRYIDQRIQERRRSQARVLAGTVIVIVILYLARQIFIPFALAILFAFLLRPIVSLLEKTFIRRTLAVTLTLAVAVTVLSFGTWMLVSQMNSLVREVAGYSGNLEKKFRFLHVSSGRTIALVEKTLEKVTEPSQRVERPDMKVRVLPEKRNLLDRYRAVAPTAEMVATAFLVIFLVFFLLKDREQLRDKLLRLAGRANLTVTTQAIGETTFRISRYLLTLALINTGFGLIIGTGLALLNVPHAALWGVLAGLLRFLPYVGAVLGAAMPTILALAVFPNWYIPAAVLGLFILADQLLGGFVEPLIVGHRVGLSPIAVLGAAIFWGWLWGPVGLLLATPITVCLTVGGEFIPALEVFSIMFGTESPLEGYLSFYNRLLTRDRSGAAALADRYCEANSIEATFADLFIPTLAFAQEERERGRITKVNEHFIKDVTRELIGRLGDRNAEVTDPAPRIVASSVGGERLSLGTLMLGQLLRAEGYAFDVLSDLTTAEILAYVQDVRPDGIFISCSSKKNLEAGLEFLRQLAPVAAHGVLMAGGSAFTSEEDQALAAGANYVPHTLSQARADLSRELKRVRRRSGRIAL